MEYALKRLVFLIGQVGHSHLSFDGSILGWYYVSSNLLRLGLLSFLNSQFLLDCACAIIGTTDREVLFSYSSDQNPGWTRLLIRHQNGRPFCRSRKPTVTSLRSPVVGSRGRKMKLQANELAHVFVCVSWYIPEWWVLEPGIRISEYPFSTNVNVEMLPYPDE